MELSPKSQSSSAAPPGQNPRQHGRGCPFDGNRRPEKGVRREEPSQDHRQADRIGIIGPGKPDHRPVASSPGPDKAFVAVIRFDDPQIPGSPAREGRQPDHADRSRPGMY